MNDTVQTLIRSVLKFGGGYMVAKGITDDSHAEILAASNGLFEIERMRNDRADYGRTCELWAASLKARKAEAIALVGKEQTRRYERYLKFAAWGFWSHRLDLLRFRLKRR